MSFGYLTTGDLQSVDYSDPATSDVTFGYDTLGRRTSMVDSAGTATWLWDSVSRLRSFTDIAGTVSYGYADAGRQATTITYPGAKTVTRAFDASGRQSSVAGWIGGTVGFGYDANSNLATSNSAATTGVEDTFGYDRANRMTAFTLRQGTNIQASLGYTRDPEGAVATSSGSGLPGTTDTFGYSPLDMLGSDSTGAYSYDAADNLTGFPDGRRQKFNAANELCFQSPTTTTSSCATLPGDATSFVYDSRGNRVSQTSPDGNTRVFLYDQADRLAGVTTEGPSRIEAGMVVAYTGTNNPPGWIEANGAAISRAQYGELFAKVGSTYGGGDGTTTFNVPDLRGRSISGLDAGQTAFDTIGELGGQAEVTLTAAQMPSHSHIQNAHTHTQDAHGHAQDPHNHTGSLSTAGQHTHLAGWDGSPSGSGNASLVENYGNRIANGSGFVGAAGNHSHTVTPNGATATNQNATATNQQATATNDSTGGGQAHSNLQPYVTVRWLIATLDGAALTAGMAVAYAGATVPTGWADGGATGSFNGRTPIGLSASNPAFDVLGETGGSTTATLTVAQMPAHTHTQQAHNHAQNAHTHTQNSHSHGSAGSSTAGEHVHRMGWAGSGLGTNNSFVVDEFGGNAHDGFGFLNTTGSHTHPVVVNNATASNQASTAVNQAATAVNQTAGSGLAHTNLQPYLTVRWIEATTQAPTVVPGTLAARAASDTSAAAGWATANGATVDRAAYPDLFASLSTAFGAGNGTTTFALPDLKGRLAVDVDPAVSEFSTVGSAGGQSTVTLSPANLPVHTHTQQPHNHTQTAHNHTQNAHGHTGSTSNAGAHTHPLGWTGSLPGTGNAFKTYGFSRLTDGDGFVEAAGNHEHTFTLPNSTATNQTTAATNQTATAISNATGGGQAHDNLQPYATLTWAVATNQTTVTFTYGGDGLRTAKTSPDGTVTRYIWDRYGSLPMLLAETIDAPGTAQDRTVRYLHGPSGVTADITTPDIGAETIRWYHQDQLGSTRTLTDNAGNIIGTAAYTPHGQQSAATGATTPIGWAGEYRDAETGLTYLRARYYDPTTAQFLTRDPLEVLTRSAYGYAGNDPINQTDPTGLFWGEGVLGDIGNFFTGSGCGDGGLFGDITDTVGEWAEDFSAAGLADFADTVGTWSGRIGVGVALLALYTSTPAGWAIGLGVLSTSAAGTQWIAGAVDGDQGHVTEGMVGTLTGVLTFGTWGALGREGMDVSSRAAAGFGLYSSTSRQGIDELLDLFGGSG